MFLFLAFFTAIAAIPRDAGAVDIERIGDSGNLASTATAISIAGPSGDKLLAAMRTNTGHLEVIRWSVAPDGDVTRVGSTTGSEIVTSTAIDSGLFPGSTTPYWANVVITDGRKKVIVWQLSSDGPARVAESLGELASSCDVATLKTAGSSSRAFFATLCQHSTDMSLEFWSLTAAGVLSSGQVIVLPAGSLPQVAHLGDGSGFARVITAYRNAAGNLRMGLHTINQFGTASNVDSSEEGGVLQVALGSNRIGEARTAVRLNNGTFKSIQWTLSSTSSLLRGASDVNGNGTGGAVGYLLQDYWGTADHNASDTLDVDVWTTVHQVDEGAGDINGAVALETGYTNGEGRMYTAVTTASGDFKLIVWRITVPPIVP